MITVLFLYRPVACFLKRMKYLSILMVGLSLLFGGCGEKKVLEGKPPREVSTDELIFRENIAYVRGETEPFGHGD